MLNRPNNRASRYEACNLQLDIERGEPESDDG